MNNNINRALLVLTLTLGFASHSAIAKDYTIAVSPFISQDDAKAQAITVLKFITELNEGDEITLVEGFNLETIGTFTIPDDPIYNSPKARLGFNGHAVGALMRFAKSSKLPNGDNEPSVIGALHLPKLLRYIANNIIGETDVIILGSPLYDDPQEPSFSMANGIYPSDGHLKHSRNKTPFGIAGNVDTLKNIRIHIGYPASYKLISDPRDYQINRFWTLYIEVQGGELISFVGDLKTLFKRVKRSMNVPKHDFKLNDSDKLEMIRLRTETIKQSIHNRPISQIPLTNRQLQRAEAVEIGISWDCECDVDLFARAFPTAETIYFNNTASPLGNLWKDHLKSPRATNGYETIAFHVPLDLRALRLAVNFYNGKAPNGVVNGQIRLSVNGQTYAKDFKISATLGNKGSGVMLAIASGVSNNPHSIIIDPLSIITVQ